MAVVNQNHNINPFLPQAPQTTKPTVGEIPSHLPLSPPEQIPNGCAPTREIHLRGQAARNLARGRVPWWILVSSWLMFIGLTQIIVQIAISSGSLASLPFIMPIFILWLIILWRGTTAKFSQRKFRSKSKKAKIL